MSRKREADCNGNLVLRLSESGEDDALPSRSISVIGTSQSWHTTGQRVEEISDRQMREPEGAGAQRSVSGVIGVD